jgi:hypothetical protein
MLKDFARAVLALAALTAWCLLAMYVFNPAHDGYPPIRDESSFQNF